MKSIKVNKEDLLDKLMVNMSAHLEQYHSALKVRRENAIVIFKAELEKMEEDPNYQPKMDFSIKLPKPESHYSEYQKVVTMLNMSVDEDVELDEHSFSELVLDEWHWKSGFSSILQSYRK